jgi:predicted ATPase
LRILRRIRETTAGELDEWPESLRKACPNGILPKDVAVLYVEPNQNGSSVKNLRINELGEFIDEWPNGFFDERIKEIF